MPARSFPRRELRNPKFTPHGTHSRPAHSHAPGHIEAADLESAIIAGKQQCIDDWSAGQTEAESFWTMETVHCLGVAAGDVEILHWQDQPE